MESLVDLVLRTFEIINEVEDKDARKNLIKKIINSEIFNDMLKVLAIEDEPEISEEDDTKTTEEIFEILKKKIEEQRKTKPFEPITIPTQPNDRWVLPYSPSPYPRYPYTYPDSPVEILPTFPYRWDDDRYWWDGTMTVSMSSASDDNTQIVY